jgi:hypothetical protein
VTVILCYQKLHTVNDSSAVIVMEHVLDDRVYFTNQLIFGLPCNDVEVEYVKSFVFLFSFYGFMCLMG